MSVCRGPRRSNRAVWRRDTDGREAADIARLRTRTDVGAETWVKGTSDGYGESVQSGCV